MNTPTTMTRTLRLGLLLVGLLLVLPTASGCLEPLAAPPTLADARDTTGSKDTGDNSWPAGFVAETDTAEVDEGGRELSFFNGLVTLDVPAGTVSEPTQITLRREIFEVDGVDLVGYIWGPHGIPINPAARLTIAALTDYVPPGVDPRNAQLFVVRDGKLEALGSPTAAEVAEPLLQLSGDLNMLLPVVIGPLAE